MEVILNKTHHSYLIEGERLKSRKWLLDNLRQEWKFKVEGNPDFSIYECETLSIEEARAIKENAAAHAFVPPKIIIIAANFLGREAQNALLKVFEEPGEDVYFFVITPNKETLLPTVKSRLVSIEVLGTQGGGEKTSLEALKFLKSNQEDRLKHLGTFLSHDSETKKSDLINFLTDIEKVLAANLKKEKQGNKPLEELLNLKKYLSDRSPSVKMIAEYLALRLPKIN